MSSVKRGGEFDLPIMDLPAFDLPTGPGIPPMEDFGSGFGPMDFGALTDEEPETGQKSVERKVAEIKTGFMARANADQKRPGHRQRVLVLPVLRDARAEERFFAGHGVW